MPDLTIVENESTNLCSANAWMQIAQYADNYNANLCSDNASFMNAQDVDI
jgi:hypothetical protein